MNDHDTDEDVFEGHRGLSGKGGGVPEGGGGGAGLENVAGG